MTHTGPGSSRTVPPGNGLLAFKPMPSGSTTLYDLYTALRMQVAMRLTFGEMLGQFRTERDALDDKRDASMAHTPTHQLSSLSEVLSEVLSSLTQPLSRLHAMHSKASSTTSHAFQSFLNHLTCFQPHLIECPFRV